MREREIEVTTYLLRKRHPFLPEVRLWFRDTLKLNANFELPLSREKREDSRKYTITG